MAINVVHYFVLTCFVTFCHSLPTKSGDSVFKIDSNRNPLLVIIFDGFRHDYIELYKAKGITLPNFEQFIKEGVRSTAVRNVFPTVTYSNHQTLVTGLYSESHGTVDNSFLDPKYPGQIFDMANQTSTNEGYWYSDVPEPIYLTNQRQGGRSAVMLYPNSDAPYNGYRPFFQVDQFWIQNGYPALYPFKQRIDRMVHWLVNRDLNVNFGLLYFIEPDQTGHNHGHDTPEVGLKLQELDGYLGYLISEIKKYNMYDDLNIIITSDHGMATVNDSTIIQLDKIVPPHLYDNPMKVQNWTLYYLYPKEGKTQEILDAINSSGDKRLKAYVPSTMPSHFHYKSHRRIAPLMIMAEPPYTIVVGNGTSTKYIGVHGYDNNNPDMWPFWVARGPAFKSNVTITDQLESVDNYPLMCHLLGISPNAHNGSLSRIAGVLKPSNSAKTFDIVNTLILISAVAVIVIHFKNIIL